MPRNLHRKPFNEGTLVKLELFRAYIVAWLSVFVKSERVTKKNVRIFDETRPSRPAPAEKRRTN